MQSTLGKGSSTKDLIIQILSEEWPLTTKQIFERLTKKSGKSSTYQAVHKTLKQMLTEQVLELQDKKYVISKKWIETNKSKYETLLKFYSGSSEKKGSFKHLEFDSLLEWGQFIIFHFYFDYPNSEKKASVCFWRHTVCSFGLSEEETEACKKLFAYAPHYGISKSTTFLDDWSAKYLGKLGKKCICGKAYSPPDYTFVQGNHLLFTFFPKELEKVFNNFYETVEELGSEEASKYMSMITTKTKIFGIIIEDKELADFWRKEAASLFGRN